jgi:hypothetical protein
MFGKQFVSFSEFAEAYAAYRLSSARPATAAPAEPAVETWTSQVTPDTCDGGPAQSVHVFVSSKFSPWEIVQVAISRVAAPPSTPASSEPLGEK